MLLLLLLRSDPRAGAGGLSLALSSALSLLPKKKSEEDALSLRTMAKMDPAAPNATTPPTLNHVDLLDEEEEEKEEVVAFSFKSNGDASSFSRLLWFMTCSHSCKISRARKVKNFGNIVLGGTFILFLHVFFIGGFRAVEM